MNKVLLDSFLCKQMLLDWITIENIKYILLKAHVTFLKCFFTFDFQILPILKLWSKFGNAYVMTFLYIILFFCTPSFTTCALDFTHFSSTSEVKCKVGNMPKNACLQLQIALHAKLSKWFVTNLRKPKLIASCHQIQLEEVQGTQYIWWIVTSWKEHPCSH
jgi:hypothetical protein